VRLGGNGKRRAAVRITVLGAVIALLPASVQAGRTGKIAGRVTGPQQRPVEAATVSLAGQPFGAYTDAQGQYTILNVPSGTYTVNVSRVGFRPLVIENVQVSADETTRLDATLEETSLSAEKVVVSAKRLPVEVNLTSSRATVTTQEIESLPVQELQDVVNLQAGVVNGHFRGGREGEVQYQVDGISMNNAFDNTPSLHVDRSLLQEVQVNSGTFDAEYGQAMSGVVNAVLKEGTSAFQWSSELFAGGFFFPGAENARRTSDPLEPGEIQNYQLSLSGPVGLPQSVYFVSGRRYQGDDYVYGTRVFRPTDRFDFETKVASPTGDRAQVALGYSDEWSGAVKLTNTSIQHVKLSYQALFNHIDGRRTDFAFRFNPDGMRQQHTSSIAHGLDWTQVFNKSTYMDLSLRQNYFSYEDFAFADLYDPRYDAAGPPKGDIDYENGAIVQGVDINRFTQKTNAFLLKSSVVSQVTHEHQLKGGFELQYPRITFGAPGTITETNGVLQRHLNSPSYPGEQQYAPLIGAAFIQDQIELKTLTVRAGARVDYFDARSTIPSDLSNPANSIQGAPESVPQPTTKKIIASPRLGVAYPITERAALHFAYGHFNQFPPIGEMFKNADFSVLDSLQAGAPSKGVFGNPDLGPERTVQYEFGYKHALTDELGFDVTVFYKDIRDLIGTAFISTYNDAEYSMLTNTDFGNVVGFTVSIDHRKFGPASVNLDYTWQQAQGNASDPRETATRAENHQDPRPRVAPFNWDQHHTLNMTVTLAKPGRGSASMVFKAASGQPYTPAVGSGFNTGLEANSGRKPAGYVIDLRGEWRLHRVRGLSFFGRVFNLTDTRYFNGPVFDTTGSPYYSLVPVTDAVALEDPTRFYPPRRIEVGLILGYGGTK
jgi:outer membrane receptor protein involved in Fe transport